VDVVLGTVPNAVDPDGHTLTYAFYTDYPTVHAVCSRMSSTVGLCCNVIVVLQLHGHDRLLDERRDSGFQHRPTVVLPDRGGH
jgi:hypothetical protein